MAEDLTLDSPGTGDGHRKWWTSGSDIFLLALICGWMKLRYGSFMVPVDTFLEFGNLLQTSYIARCQIILSKNDELPSCMEIGQLKYFGIVCFIIEESIWKARLLLFVGCLGRCLGNGLTRAPALSWVQLWWEFYSWNKIGIAHFLVSRVKTTQRIWVELLYIFQRRIGTLNWSSEACYSHRQHSLKHLWCGTIKNAILLFKTNKNKGLNTLRRGTAWRGCSPTQTKSLPTPLSMTRCLVTLVSSLSTSKTPTPGVTTMDSWPVRSKLLSK